MTINFVFLDIQSLATFVGHFWALVTFILTMRFLDIQKTCFWPKKVGFWPLLGDESGQKMDIQNSKMDIQTRKWISKNGVKTAILRCFWVKTALDIQSLAKWPLFFLINCEKKY